MISASEESKSPSAPEAVEEMKWRDSTQPLMKSRLDAGAQKPGQYNPFPYYAIGAGKIFSGFESLAEWIIRQNTVLIDGYGGVFFEEMMEALDRVFQKKGLLVRWHFVNQHLKTEQEIDTLVQPFLGGAEEVWGKKADISLAELFEPGLKTLVPDESADLNIAIGIGAGLLDWKVPVIYLDIPKNEVQYRMRAGSLSNLGKSKADSPFTMYKRFYFVDWPVLDRHRNALLDRVEVVADGQWNTTVNWMLSADLAEALRCMSRTVFRARPWFEKGAWGGQWMKDHLEGLNKEELNYAWSFELISPENGLVMESSGLLLEVSFDWLMQYAYQEVIGQRAEEFGPYFPIRFDFLDTFDGGNLSIQCHPSKPYISAHFGEAITQDETYYILDCKPGAKVYLGFQDDIQPADFRVALEKSQLNNEPLEVDRYVQSFPSHRHDLFLIPNGTIHSSGKNNMVLEISATPYIFTFKMYDWLSLDLEGKPRPINIAHAFNNLRFERKGETVAREHLSKPSVLEKGADWERIHLPTHRDHFYDVHRLEFDTEIAVDTQNSCQVLMMVEGSFLSIEIEGFPRQSFAYAETFVVPAATRSFRLINEGNTRAKVIQSFLKPN